MSSAGSVASARRVSKACSDSKANSTWCRTATSCTCGMPEGVEAAMTLEEKTQDAGRVPPLRVADLAPGMHPDGVLVVKKKVRREQPDGSRYLLFQLADRSGQINAVLWHSAELVDAQIAPGDLARVRGEG